MRYQTRTLQSILTHYLDIFPVVAITGPRQSGKSTMIKQMLGEHYTYVTFDDFRVIEQLHDDPERFLSVHDDKVIFDEVQKYPAIFPLLKRKVDEDREHYGKFILTGSSQFSLQQNSSETLAGRIGLLTLFPFDIREMPDPNAPIENGCYPEQVMRDFLGNRAWYGSYLETYVQRDIRSLAQIGDLHDFSRLIKLLAANVSQQFNASSYAKAIGVSVPTIKRWVSVLEASYIIYLLRPYHTNLNKRIIKSPKLYFYDTGLASYLNGAMDSTWEDGPLAGPLFENYIVTECIKGAAHSKTEEEFYYFREHNGDEIDLIIETPKSRRFLEIKHSMTFKTRMVKHLHKYMDPDTKAFLLYQGESMNYSKEISVCNFREYLLGT